ncbi:MAG: hypothetical protein ACO3CU_11185, partial [Candidatus Nanopelagicales bacterium]
MVEGSTWVQDGAIFRLEACPTGYFVSPKSTEAFDAAQQRCLPCGKGEECTHNSSCIECSACAPGMYKAAVSTEPCVSCPANTYREGAGATDLGMCLSCLARSSTQGAVGQSSWRACVCDSDYYRIVANSADDACLECPAGLTCQADMTYEPVVPGSNWTMDGAIFRLQSCPSGYYVSPRASETFNAALQQCLPCGKGEECTGSACIECSACAPGMYKAAVSTDPCLACPANTYSEGAGASDLGMCLGCQVKSSTLGLTGRSSRRACACDVEYYLITTDEGTAGEA